MMPGGNDRLHSLSVSYVVGFKGHLCVLMDKMRCFEFWSFYLDIDVLVLMVTCHPAWVVYPKKKLRICFEGIVVLYAFM
jgi:hypothetical protein